VLTDAAGRFSGTVKFAHAGHWTVRAEWGGDATRPASTATCELDVGRVPSALALTCPADSKSGGTIPVSGKLDPPLAATIALTYTYTTANPDEVTKREVTSDVQGNFAENAYVPPGKGETTVQATWAGDADHEPAASPVCTVPIT
jgi:hypothetical protein